VSDKWIRSVSMLAHSLVFDEEFYRRKFAANFGKLLGLGWQYGSCGIFRYLLIKLCRLCRL